VAVFQIVSGVHFISLRYRTYLWVNILRPTVKVMKGKENGYLPLQFLINAVI